MAMEGGIPRMPRIDYGVSPGGRAKPRYPTYPSYPRTYTEDLDKAKKKYTKAQHEKARKQARSGKYPSYGGYDYSLPNYWDWLINAAPPAPWAGYPGGRLYSHLPPEDQQKIADYARSGRYTNLPGYPGSTGGATTGTTAPPGGAPPKYPKYPRYPGGGRMAAPPEVTWDVGYSVEGAPAWWKGFTPSEVTPESEYLATLNAMIPYLSPEDQRAVVSTLMSAKPEVFAGYSPEKITFDNVTNVTPDIVGQYTSTQRARRALDTLDKMQAAMGTDKKFGEGYTYMRQILDTLGDYGGSVAQNQTHAQRRALLGAIDPLLSQAGQGALMPFASLANMLVTPYFSAGEMYPITHLPNGKWIFGTPNKGLY